MDKQDKSNETVKKSWRCKFGFHDWHIIEKPPSRASILTAFQTSHHSKTQRCVRPGCERIERHRWGTDAMYEDYYRVDVIEG